jgi:hypothetical protein
MAWWWPGARRSAPAPQPSPELVLPSDTAPPGGPGPASTSGRAADAGQGPKPKDDKLMEVRPVHVVAVGSTVVFVCMAMTGIATYRGGTKE